MSSIDPLVSFFPVLALQVHTTTPCWGQHLSLHSVVTNPLLSTTERLSYLSSFLPFFFLFFFFLKVIDTCLFPFRNGRAQLSCQLIHRTYYKKKFYFRFLFNDEGFSGVLNQPCCGLQFQSFPPFLTNVSSFLGTSWPHDLRTNLWDLNSRKGGCLSLVCIKINGFLWCQGGSWCEVPFLPAPGWCKLA